MTDLKDHLARERRLSRWLARVRGGEPVECGAWTNNCKPRPSREERARQHDELRAMSGGEWTRGDRA